MKKTLAILLSILMLVLTAVPAMAADATCPECEKNTLIYYMTVVPTCTEEGYTLWKCNNAECGYEVKMDTVDALGHDYKEDYTHVDEGCTEGGYKHYAYDHRYCDRCGFEDRINEKENPVHEYKQVGNVPATCTEPEKDLLECIHCGKTKTRTTPNGDYYTGHEMKLVSAPKTCMDEAVEYYKCKKCGFESTKLVTPVDHVDENADGVCDVCEKEIELDDEPHGFYAQIIKWITEIIEAFKAFLASIKGDSIF